MAFNFPEGFTWGVAASAYQIEGAVGEDGRGQSIWDTFSHTPGKVKNDDHGDLADDHYHRWREDIRLMQALNVGAYRLSIAWPRILPGGRGAVNQAGIDFYSRLVDGLLDAGITPYVTLYHWDLPQVLQDEGGWTRRGLIDDFVRYADVVSRALGDRVKHWITFNEPWCLSWLGYVLGTHAPGLISESFAPALLVSHHVNVAHGLTVPVLRANSSGARVGISIDFNPVEPASDDPADQAAAQIFSGFRYRWYVDPLFRAQYPPDMVQLFGDAVPEIQPGDLQTAAAPLDFLGINYYSRAVIKAGSSPAQPFENVLPPDSQYTAMGWEVYPQGLYNLITELHREYAPPAIYVTENGAAYDDLLTPDGHVHDQQRTDYLRGHFEAVQRAIAEGVPLKGYFVWSMMDNFEWAEGYSKRFGLYYVDFATQRRYLKDSGAFFAQVAAGKA